MKKNILLFSLQILILSVAIGQDIPLEVEGGENIMAASIISTSTDKQVLTLLRDAVGVTASDVLELKMNDASSSTAQFIEAEIDNGPIIFRLNKSGNIKTNGRLSIGQVFDNEDDEINIYDFDGDGDAIIRTSQGPHELVFGSNVSNEGLIGTTTDSRFSFRTNNVTRAILSKDGDFGIGTPGPVRRLHVRDDGIVDQTTFVAVMESVVSKRPAILFSEGGANQSNGMSIEYDGTSSGINNNLRINTSAGDVGIMVKNNGHAGINGGASNLSILRINQETGVPRGLEITNSVGGNFWGFTHASGLQLDFNGSLRGTFNDVNGNYTSVSDRRLKSNITPLEDDGLEKVMMLNPVSYTFKDQEGDSKSIGFIAQEIEVLYPELINHVESNGQDLLTLSYSEFGVIAIKAIQEQQMLIDQIQDELSQVSTLRSELEVLKSQLTATINDSTQKASK